jgi:hypothetical protein
MAPKGMFSSVCVCARASVLAASPCCVSKMRCNHTRIAHTLHTNHIVSFLLSCLCPSLAPLIIKTDPPTYKWTAKPVSNFTADTSGCVSYVATYEHTSSLLLLLHIRLNDSRCYNCYCHTKQCAFIKASSMKCRHSRLLLDHH